MPSSMPYTRRGQEKSRNSMMAADSPHNFEIFSLKRRQSTCDSDNGDGDDGDGDDDNDEDSNNQDRVGNDGIGIYNSDDGVAITSLIYYNGYNGTTSLVFDCTKRSKKCIERAIVLNTTKKDRVSATERSDIQFLLDLFEDDGMVL